MLKNTKLYSILNNKCPKCCIGDFYKDKNVYNLKTFVDTPDKCPHCGESYFTAQTMHEIERIKLLRKSLAVKTTVPVATFLAAA